MFVVCMVFLSSGFFVFAQKNDKNAQVQQVKEEEVYVSPKDRKYHKMTCPLLESKKAEKMSKKEALNKGLFPCPECFREDYPVQTKEK